MKTRTVMRIAGLMIAMLCFLMAPVAEAQKKNKNKKAKKHNYHSYQPNKYYGKNFVYRIGMGRWDAQQKKFVYEKDGWVKRKNGTRGSAATFSKAKYRHVTKSGSNQNNRKQRQQQQGEGGEPEETATANNTSADSTR